MSGKPKVGQLTDFIRGTHVLGKTTGDYFAAKAAVNALRCHSTSATLQAIKNALKNYRVKVHLTDDNKIAVLRDDGEKFHF